MVDDLLNLKLTDKTKGRVVTMVRVLLATAIAFGICQFEYHESESWTYDFRVRFKPDSHSSGLIRLVTIDKKTIRELSRLPDANEHALLLENLRRVNPRAVVYAMGEGENLGFYDLEGALEDKLRMARAAEGMSNLYVTENIKLRIQGEEDLLKLPPPLHKIPTAMMLKSHDKSNFAGDEVTRRVFLSYQEAPLLPLLLANEITGYKSADDYRGVFPFLGSKQSFINFHPNGFYPNESFVDVINNRFQAEQYAGKIVLIGHDSFSDSKDYVKTPYSRETLSMSLLEAFANSIDTVITNSAPIKAPRWLTIFITVLISLLTVHAVFTLNPIQGLTVLGLTLTGFLGTAWLAFAAFGVWIEVIPTLITIFLCYYFFIPYRLIMENKKSWEYFQHNKMLRQVEELKTNFLKMMSHDLRTPLARIQGMTEVALQENANLSSLQKNALQNISQSTQELTQFIGSILDLTRVESNEVKLQLKSKDINQVLEKVVDKVDFLAQKKKIDILTEFEPIFSVKIDEDLMSQVFSNLIENAIKYSPDKSKILISTEEKDGKVVVQVADQGQGIARDEQRNIFEKFYRSRDAATSTIRGSGLGLYLSKYFVELHKGRLSVESQPAHGSTFIVELPTDHNTRGDKHV
jgi:signal transduction histidine kinase